MWENKTTISKKLKYSKQYLNSPADTDSSNTFVNFSLYRLIVSTAHTIFTKAKSYLHFKFCLFVIWKDILKEIL